MNLTGSLDCQCGNASPRHAMATKAIVVMNTRAPNWLFSAIGSFVNSCRSGGQFLPKRTVVHYYRVLQTPQQLASVMKSSPADNLGWQELRPAQEERNGSNRSLPPCLRHLVALPACWANLSQVHPRDFAVAD